MNRQEMIGRITQFDNSKEPGFSTESVGQALGCDYTDKRIRLDGFDFSKVSDDKLAKIVAYIETALEAYFLEEELW